MQKKQDVIKQNQDISIASERKKKQEIYTLHQKKIIIIKQTMKSHDSKEREKKIYMQAGKEHNKLNIILTLDKIFSTVQGFKLRQRRSFPYH